MVNALFATGGPSEKGSLRAIQLRRAGKTMATFDLYDLLLQGDKSKDMPLMPGDVIFIPPAQQQVAITGPVNQPAIYEILPGDTLETVLQLARGDVGAA